MTTQLNVQIERNVIPITKYSKILGFTFDSIFTFTKRRVGIIYSRR